MRTLEKIKLEAEIVGWTKELRLEYQSLLRGEEE